MDKEKVLSLLGLCQRANRLVSGEDMSLAAIKNKQAKLVFLAQNAGPNTSKRICDKSSTYDVPVIDVFDSDELSKSIGKSNRKVLVVKDAGFAKKMLSLLK
jgi:ribosomal protein L7Ae-like RNA K-turn-binding protein